MTIAAGSRTSKAVAKMAEENVGLLVIVDPQELKRVVGVLSERDVIKALAAGESLERPVEELGVTSRLVTVRVGDPVSKAASLFNVHPVRHLVVLDDRDQLAGVLLVQDLVGEKVLLSLAEHAGEYPEEVHLQT